MSDHACGSNSLGDVLREATRPVLLTKPNVSLRRKTILIEYGMTENQFAARFASIRRARSSMKPHSTRGIAKAV